jgi:hypothetical protein
VSIGSRDADDGTGEGGGGVALGLVASFWMGEGEGGEREKGRAWGYRVRVFVCGIVNVVYLGAGGLCGRDEEQSCENDCILIRKSHYTIPAS